MESGIIGILNALGISGMVLSLVLRRIYMINYFINST